MARAKRSTQARKSVSRFTSPEQVGGGEGESLPPEVQVWHTIVEGCRTELIWCLLMDTPVGLKLSVWLSAPTVCIDCLSLLTLLKCVLTAFPESFTTSKPPHQCSSCFPHERSLLERNRDVFPEILRRICNLSLPPESKHQAITDTHDPRPWQYVSLFVFSCRPLSMWSWPLPSSHSVDRAARTGRRLLSRKL